MYKLLTTLSVLTATLLLSGCGNTDTMPIKNIEQNNKSSIKAKVSKNIIEAGESIDYEVANSDNVTNIAWRDQNGKLLSTKTKFNRLFQNEGKYITTLTITDKDGNIFTETISIKVNRHSLVDEALNLQPIVQAEAEKLELMEKESIHLSDTGSYDPDGEIVNYAWRDQNGILLSETKTLDRVMYYYPQFDTNNDGITRYIKTLYVTDNKGALASKSFTIIVHKKKPIKDEETDQVIKVVDYEYSSSNHGTITYTYDKNENLLSKKIIRYNEYTLISTILITYTYDKNGNMLTKNIDSDYDGEIDGSTTFTYDKNGNMLTKIESGNVGWTYSKNGGIILFNDYKGDTTTWTYDENGNMLTKSFDRYSDGTIDIATSFSKDAIKLPDRYDKDGNIYKILTKSYDWNSDGIIDRIFTYTYNEDGTLKSKTYDVDKSKKYVYSYYSFYDSFGNLRQNYDIGARKIAQEIPKYIEDLSTYYENGSVHKLVLNTESDGKTPYNAYNYSKNGNLISLDPHVASVMDGYYYYNYDNENKNMIISGNTELEPKYRYTYDENGNMLTQNIQYKAKADTKNKDFTYNKENLMTSMTTYNLDGDATVKDFTYSYYYTYDENGNLLIQEASNSENKITITYTWGII